MTNKKTATSQVATVSAAAGVRRAPSTRKKRKVLPFDASSDDENNASTAVVDDAEFVVEANVDSDDDGDATAPDIDNENEKEKEKESQPRKKPAAKVAAAPPPKPAVVVDFSSVPEEVAKMGAFDLNLLDSRSDDAHSGMLRRLVAAARDMNALASDADITKRHARVVLRELARLQCIVTPLDDVFAGQPVEVSLAGRAILAKRDQLVEAHRQIVRAPEVDICGDPSCRQSCPSRLRCSGCHVAVFCNDRCLDESYHSQSCTNDSNDPRRSYLGQTIVVNLALPVPDPEVSPKRGITTAMVRGRGAARARARGRGGAARARARARGGRGGAGNFRSDVMRLVANMFSGYGDEYSSDGMGGY
jgi:hypothetical protein